MMILAAVLVFLLVVTLLVGGWSIWSRNRSLRARVTSGAHGAPETGVLRVERAATGGPWEALFRKSALITQMTNLSEQAGRRQSATDLFLLIAVCAAVGAVVGWWRIGQVGGAVLLGLVGAALPVVHLVWKRHNRLKRLEEQFSDAVDMIARSIRAGNALTAAIQLVGEEMAEPTGGEFRQMSDEIRLGLDPGEALARLEQRVPTEDMRFFCAAIAIQRGSGGNLAEILDRLSDVIRKRFELLSHARVLSAQQRYAGIFVGLSPLLFSLLFYFLSPGYFDPLIKSPAAPMLVGGGLTMELVGFLIIWRLAKIKV